MGIDPGPNGYDLGAPCVFCWGDSTPLRMLAIVDGVSACPGHNMNPNGFYILVQAGPCTWVYNHLPWHITYWATVGMPAPGAMIQIVDWMFRNYFTGFVDSMCTMSFSNQLIDLDCGGNVKGYGGSVGLLFGPGI